MQYKLCSGNFDFMLISNYNRSSSWQGLGGASAGDTGATAEVKVKFLLPNENIVPLQIERSATAGQVEAVSFFSFYLRFAAGLSIFFLE